MVVRGVSPRRPIACGLAVLAGSLAFACGLAVEGSPARAQQGSVVTVSVPAGSLESALLALGRQANLKLVYSSALTSGRQTGGVSGQLSSQSAVAQLLAGTGLSYSFTGSNTVRIYDPNVVGGNDAAATVEGAIALDTIDVGGAGASAGARPGEAFTADTPFATAGSVSHISQEQIERVRAQTAGDIFRSTPGVISSGSRGTSIQPNIRGLQGAGRVKTTIDGAEQNTTSYRGYIGNRDETYIDPDLIGGVDITKGPAGGTIGGLVAFRTISAPDIITGDKNWGLQLKGGIGNNDITPPPDNARHYELEGRDRPSFFDGETWNGSIAGAVDYENFEGIVAYAKRKRGNYFAGTRTNGDIGSVNRLGVPSEAFSRPGEEVPNSSEDTESLLAKGKLKWSDNQSLELGYRSFDSISGEIIEQGSLLANIEWPLAHIDAKSYTSAYRWNSDQSDLINLRANLWRTTLAVDTALDDTGRESEMWGWNIANTFEFDTSNGFFSLDAGVDHTHEEHRGDANALWGGGVNADRTTTGVFADGRYDPVDWLSLTGGVRHDWFENERKMSLSGYPRSWTHREGSGVSFNAGITLTPVDDLQLFSLFKQGLKPPAAREFGLEPERANSYEFGFNLLRDGVLVADDKLRFKATAFHNTYDDYIVRYRASVNLPYYALNIDKAVYQGFEVSGSYDAGRFFLEGAFTNYIDIEYCMTTSACSSFTFSSDYGGGYVPPKFHGSLTAGVRLLDRKLTLGARTHFASERIGGRTTTGGGGIGPPVTWPQYGVYDLFGSYKLNEHAELNASVENVTDEYYLNALTSILLASPGRTGTLSFTARF